MASEFSSQSGPGQRPDLSALTARLDEFERRLSDVRMHNHLVEARTAAYILLQAEGPRPQPQSSVSLPRGVRVAVSHATD